MTYHHEKPIFLIDVSDKKCVLSFVEVHSHTHTRLMKVVRSAMKTSSWEEWNWSGLVRHFAVPFINLKSFPQWDGRHVCTCHIVNFIHSMWKKCFSCSHVFKQRNSWAPAPQGLSWSANMSWPFAAHPSVSFSNWTNWLCGWLMYIQYLSHSFTCRNRHIHYHTYCICQWYKLQFNFQITLYSLFFLLSLSFSLCLNENVNNGICGDRYFVEVWVGQLHNESWVSLWVVC